MVNEPASKSVLHCVRIGSVINLNGVQVHAHKQAFSMNRVLVSDMYLQKAFLAGEAIRLVALIIIPGVVTWEFCNLSF